MLTTSRNPGVIHAGHESSKPSRGVLGFMMSCLASVIMLRVLLTLFQDNQISEQNKLVAAGLSVVCCLLFYLGTSLFFSFITGYSRKLSISKSGIRYGAAYFTWPHVRLIGAHMKRGCFQVHIVLKRGWFANRWLVTDDGMSQEMSEEFIEALRKQILPHFPQLVIDELPSLQQTSAVTESFSNADVKSAA